MAPSFCPRSPCSWARRVLYGLAMSAPLLSGRPALLHHSRELSTGSLELVWKSWVDPHCESLRWEVRRLLPSAGYVVTPKYRVHEYVRDQLVKWQQVWNTLGFDGEIFGRPRLSPGLVPTIATEFNHTEDEYWVDIAAMLSLLLFWREYRKGADNKEKPTVALELFLDKVLSADAVLALQPLIWRDACLLKCDVQVVGNACKCVRNVNGVLETHRLPTAAPHAKLSIALGALFAARKCAAVAAQCHELLKGISTQALATQTQWGDADLSKSFLSGASGKKKRRVDMHLKLELASAREASMPGTILSKVDSKAIPRWKLERMRYVLANNHLCCSPLHVISSAFDAGRVGKPSLELLLHVVLVGRSSVSTPLPPRVPTNRD